MADLLFFGCYFYEEHAVRHDLEKIEAGLAARSDDEARMLLWSNAATLYGVAPPDRSWPGAAARAKSS